MFTTKFAAILVSLVLACTSVHASPADVEGAFRQAKVVPDVLSTFHPSALLQIVYPVTNISSTAVAVNKPGAYLTMNRERYLRALLKFI